VDKKKREQLKAWSVLEGQIALLKTGTRATDYACRHVLDVGLDVDFDGVVAALHKKLHTWDKLPEDMDSRAWAVAYATAAKQLLTGLLKR